MCCLQELGPSGDQEGSVRSREAWSSADGGDHPQLPDVRQVPAPGGFSGQRGAQTAPIPTNQPFVFMLITVFCVQLYYHGEPISVNVHVTNNSTKTVKRVKISGTHLWTLPALLCSPSCCQSNAASVCLPQCVSTQTSACSALPSTNVQWLSWRQSKCPCPCMLVKLV